MLFYTVPEQLPENFKISPLPPEIISWLYALLQSLKIQTQCSEAQQTRKIMIRDAGGILRNIINGMRPIDRGIFLISKDQASCRLLPIHERSLNFLAKVLIIWLSRQSMKPWNTWQRPSGITTKDIQGITKVLNLHDFYSDSKKAIKTLTH